MMKKAVLLGGALALVSGATFAQAYGGYASPAQNQPMGSPPQAAMPGTAGMNQAPSTEVPLSEVSASDNLSSASLQDMQGDSIGSVRKVLSGSSGKPAAVQVDAGGFLGVPSKIVNIKAPYLRYERDRNVLITNMSKDEIKALPSVTGM